MTNSDPKDQNGQYDETDPAELMTLENLKKFRTMLSHMNNEDNHVSNNNSSDESNPSNII